MFLKTKLKDSPNDAVPHVFPKSVFVSFRRPHLSVEEFLHGILNAWVKILECRLCVNVRQTLFAKRIEMALTFYLEDDFLKIGVLNGKFQCWHGLKAETVWNWV